jgi:hypothetical protein
MPLPGDPRSATLPPLRRLVWGAIMMEVGGSVSVVVQLFSSDRTERRAVVQLFPGNVEVSRPRAFWPCADHARMAQLPALRPA